MVNHSLLVIAVFNGQSGGTKNTIEYAKVMNVEIRADIDLNRNRSYSERVEK